MILWLIYEALNFLWELLQRLPWQAKLWIVAHFQIILSCAWACAVGLIYYSLLPDRK